MSKIAIWEGLGRRRKARRIRRRRGLKMFGVSPKAKPGRHWHMNKDRKKGARTAAQKTFKDAAKSCKVMFKRTKGGAKTKRRAYNVCVKNYMLKH